MNQEAKRLKRLAGIKETKFSMLSESTILDKKPQLDPNEYLHIDTPAGGGNYNMFVSLVNQGIDSHLEGFTKSKFQLFMQDGQKRMSFDFHKSELPVLLRRLDELGENGNEEADSWASDIRQSEGMEDEYGSPINESKVIKISILSESLRKDIKSFLKEGKVKLGELPQETKNSIMEELGLSNSYPKMDSDTNNTTLDFDLNSLFSKNANPETRRYAKEFCNFMYEFGSEKVGNMFKTFDEYVDSRKKGNYGVDAIRQHFERK